MTFQSIEDIIDYYTKQREETKMKVELISQLLGLEYAAQRHNRWPKDPALKLTLENGSSQFTKELSVKEAKEIAQELMDYAKDIEVYAASLKEIEEVG